MSSGSQISMPDTVKVMTWADRNKAEIALVNRKEAIRRCKADTGVDVPYNRMKEMEEIYNIKRIKAAPVVQATPEEPGIKTVAAELVRLMDSLGFAPDPKLKAMVGG